MKVAIELQPCLKNRSGIGVYTYELSKRLQKYDDLEIKGDIFNFLNRNDLTADLSGLDFDMNTCKLFPYGVYRRIWRYVPINYKMLFQCEADITHFFNFIVPPGVNGKVVNTIHDLTYRFYPETMDKSNFERINRDIQYSIERADRIVTISQCSKQDLIQEIGIDEDKIEIIYPGVDYERFSNVQDIKTINRVRQKYHLPEKFVLYMGTLEPRKNIPFIIEAFSKLKAEGDAKVKDIKLVLAGKKGWLFEEIFKRVKVLNLEDQVIFTDYVAEEDKPTLYSLASAFVFPSFYEGFGIPVLEAMSASVPVIASNVSSLPEVVGNAAFLVNPRDTVSMAEGMYRVLNDLEYRKILIENGHKQALKFNWEDSAQKLHQLYASII